jgi:RNA polymerase sigma factor (sigma-70 family)
VTHTAARVLTTLADLDRADRTDGQLLGAFARGRDEAAFAALVRRHGPMVLGVCRRVLRNGADADDAFQAAFLVLARRAAALGPREVLAGFLHRVAFNTARKLREANRRRAAREAPLAGVAEPAAGTDDARDELLAVLDEEVSRLPDRYRVPVVLCDLQGATRREAALRLGWPEGTVAGRLARARKLLADRLAARGVAPAAGVVVVVPGASAVAGVVRLAAGGAAPARVAELSQGVLTAMFAKKLRAAAAVVLTAGLVVAGAYRAATARPDPAPPPVAKGEKAAPAPPADSRGLTVIPLKKLDPEATAKVVADGFKGKGVTVVGVPEEKLLLVYADEKVVAEVRAVLLKLGEAAPPPPRVFRLDGVSAPAAARELNEIFNGPGGKLGRVTVVPIADANALLVYGAPIDLLTVEKLLEKQISREPAPAPKPATEKTFSVNFRTVPWDHVLAWYAEMSGLTPIHSVKPTGTLTVAAPKGRALTLAEVTDLLNDALMQQKFILVRRRVSFTILPSDEKIDPTAVPRIELSELPKRGTTELVQVLLPLKTLSVEDVAPEVKAMLSPFGTAAPLKGLNSLILLDTAGNVRRVVDTLQKVEEAPDRGDTLTHKFVYRKAAEEAEKLKTLLADKDTPSTIDPRYNPYQGPAGRGRSVTITVNERNNSVTVTAPPDKLALARKLIEASDKPLYDGQKPVPSDDPELRKYSVPRGTADEIAKAVGASYPGVRVVPLIQTDEIMVYGTPAEHAQLARQLNDLTRKDDPKEPGKPAAPAPRPDDPALPELRKYSVPRGNPVEVVKAVGVLCPDARVVALPASDEVLVYGTPAEHAHVADTLGKLFPGARQVPEKK